MFSGVPVKNASTFDYIQADLVKKIGLTLKNDNKKLMNNKKTEKKGKEKNNNNKTRKLKRARNASYADRKPKR